MSAFPISRVRSLFPSRGPGVDFDHASISPVSSRVADAMRAAASTYLDGYQTRWRDDAEDVRRSVATLVGSRPRNIAFSQNTTTGLSIAANGLDWREGDNVVVPEHEFPSNVYPWMNLERRGVEVRRASAPDGHTTLDRVREAMDGRTRVVTVSSVQYSTGHRYDLAALAALCREHGALLVVDGTQSVGALTIDVAAASVDVLAVSAHKWMLGPAGIGFVHLSDRAMDRITPDIVGWLSVVEPFAFDGRLDLPDSADRYEPGTENTLGILGLGAAVDLFLELGPTAVEDRVLALTDRVRTGLERTGHRLLSPGGAARSGITIFSRDGTPAEVLHARLTAAGIRCAPRGGGVRFSPHMYNLDDEVDLAIAALAPSGQGA